MLSLGRHNVSLRKEASGNLYLRSEDQLSEYAENTGMWVEKQAQEKPDTVFIAERSGKGWRELTYRELLQSVRALAVGLMSRGIRPCDRILIISGNGVDHAILALAAQYIGVAVIPLAEQYALIPEARDRLLHAVELTKPKMVYASDVEQFGPALDMLSGLDVIVSRGGNYSTLDELMSGGGIDLDSVRKEVTPDHVVKILLTSGSSSTPKAVPTTHKMMCANQAQLRDAMPFLAEKKPVIMDWLPWNHVFGGSHNFNMVLANGGTLYIDDGKPTEKLFARSIENLKMHTGTLSFNVPLGYSMLAEALLADDDLAKRFFENLDLIFYAGASLPQEVWKTLENLALKFKGNLPLMTTSWGLTETAPACVMQQEVIRESGIIGVPLNGVELKMVPLEDGRYEVRTKGPNVMTGYLDSPEFNTKAFDNEGFFITGDAMVFVNPDEPRKGLKFSGRISDEFKLQSGTWVRSSSLRLELIGELKGKVSDIVITGADRADIGLFIFPIAGDDIESLKKDITEILTKRAQKGQSNSSHIARAMILTEPPSFEKGEVTAKGNLNANKILLLRKSYLEKLYEGGEDVIEFQRVK